MSKIRANRWETLDGKAAGVIYVDTIAALQALPTANLASGQSANVRGSSFTFDGANWQPNGYVTLMAFGAAGDGVADDTSEIGLAIESGWRIDGNGLTFKCNSVPNLLMFSNANFRVGNIDYPTDDYLTGNVSKITSTPYYTAWAQDKSFDYNNSIYVPFKMAHGHTSVDAYHAWVYSHDGGSTYSAPEIILGLHPDPENYGYNVFAAGQFYGRFFMFVEERRISDSRIVGLYMYDRTLDKSWAKENGISLVAGSEIATIFQVDHGFAAGDSISFSGVTGDGVGGLSGRLVVESVIDKDHFTVDKGSASSVDATDTGGNYFLSSSFYYNDYRVTEMPLFEHDITGVAVTHVHSFTTVAGSQTLYVGFHNGSGGGRECGVIQIDNAFSSSPSFTKKRFPEEFEQQSVEPCLLYRDGRLYATTRGQSPTVDGSALIYSDDAGDTWEGHLFPGNLHYDPIPFEIIDGYLYAFGTERAEGEWDRNNVGRLIQSRPRSFVMRVPLANAESGTWEGFTTTLIGYGIYAGEYVSTACGVGSCVFSNGKLHYFFGSEDYRLYGRYASNTPSVRDQFIGQGYQPDLFVFALEIDKIAGKGFDFRGVDARTLGQYRDNNESLITAPLEFTRTTKGVRFSGRSNSRVGSNSRIVDESGIKVVYIADGVGLAYVDTEAGAPSSNLNRIYGNFEDGDEIILKTPSSSREVVLQNGSSLRIAGTSYALSSARKFIRLTYIGGVFFETGRGDNI